MFRIDFYKGAYGPTIRLETQDEADLKLIEGIFAGLAVSERHEVELCEALAASVENVESLLLRVAERERPGRKALARVSKWFGKGSFVWSRSPLGWQQCVGLVQGLAEEGEAGHQYLTDEGVDDALVELSFGEGGAL